MSISIKSYLRFLTFSFLVFSIDALAEFSWDCYDCTQVNTHTYGTCSDLAGCLTAFGPRVSGSITMFPTGDFYLSNNRIIMEYAYSNESSSAFRTLVLTPQSDDCYSGTNMLACGLSCNSAESCLPDALSQCGGYMESYSYKYGGSYDATCGIIDISEGDDDTVITSETISVITAQGSRGIAGTNGINGTDGTNGTDGVDGVDGEVGADGADGVAGVDGADGADGATGADGADGVAGADGINGANGRNGIDGAQGIQGATGATGADGVVDDEVLNNLLESDTRSFNRLNILEASDLTQVADIESNKQDLHSLFAKDLVLLTGQELIDADVKSNTGQIVALDTAVKAIESLPIPENGTDGVNGIDGANGIDGTNGVDGTNGTNGVDGVDGVAGADGLAGNNGLNGIDGLDGLDGQNVDTDAVVHAIYDSTEFLKQPHVISPNVNAYSGYSSLFSLESRDILLADVEVLKGNIQLENKTFLEEIKAKFTFSTSSSGYQSRVIDLTNWGSHDVSISRYAEHFGGLGNIVYFFASLLALSIILSGIRP